MKKKLLSLLLALTMCLSLLPAVASAAENDLPDWYFLFAIFKNVDADGKDSDGAAAHVTYSMSQEEVDVFRDIARSFEEYMNRMGVMRAHVDVVEIDAALTELYDRDSGGSYVGAAQAAPLLQGKVDLDRYDHVACIVGLDNLATRYVGVSGSAFENGAGHSCINFVNRENCLNSYVEDADGRYWPAGVFIHEFLHFMERMGKKWGETFNLHLIQDLYRPNRDAWRTCYTNTVLNRVEGTAETGTGVSPLTWQYPPHVLRTIKELTIPSGVTSLGHDAFLNYTNLTSVIISSSVTCLDVSAFHACTGLTRVTIPSSVTAIGDWAFNGCTALKDIYYTGTETQWKAIQTGDYNKPLTNATIHYNSLMADVKTSDWFAQPVAWALEQGVTNGTGGGKFSPDVTCNQAQILTFLWRAKGEPKPSGAVSGTEFYASAVQWAREQGLVSGSFSPDAPCTRADVVTYLWKLAGSPAAGTANFSDVPASANCAQAVAWAVSKGVTNGTGNGQFSPDAACTRGQIVTFLYRALV